MILLIYVPVIHTSADLGSLAKDIGKRGTAELGEETWDQHIRTVEAFWEILFRYFDSVEVSGMKVYQDGMVAEGKVGEEIVREGTNLGSKNHQLVAKLLERGATLVKTELFQLVKEERDHIVKITQAKTLIGKITAYIKYKLTKNRLLKRRDNYVTRRINETLQDGETGILFLGAAHDIISKLSKNIKVTEVKEIKKVRKYQRLLLSSRRRNKEQFEELSKYLVTPVG